VCHVASFNGFLVASADISQIAGMQFDAETVLEQQREF
jgi:hypothetical protein